MVRHVCVALISFYQRFVSPYKGFRCAYGVYHGHDTCSGIVKQIVLNEGLLGGWPKIRAQFDACRRAFVQLSDQLPESGDESEESDEDEDENDDKSKKGFCFDMAPAVCLVPDPSDCALGGVAEGASGACTGVGEAIGGVCSCM